MWKSFSENNANQITINGKSISVSGKNITINNGKVIVDGVVIEEGLSDNVTIKFEGDLASLRADGSVTVNGDVHSYVNCRGSATINGDVGDYVDAGGSVSCSNVQGDVDAGGSVFMKR